VWLASTGIAQPTLRLCEKGTTMILAYIDNKLSMLAWDAFDEQEQRLLLSIESHIGQRTNEAEI
jgi:hypothetical protein